LAVAETEAALSSLCDAKVCQGWLCPIPNMAGARSIYTYNIYAVSMYSHRHIQSIYVQHAAAAPEHTISTYVHTTSAGYMGGLLCAITFYVARRKNQKTTRKNACRGSHSAFWHIRSDRLLPNDDDDNEYEYEYDYDVVADVDNDDVVMKICLEFSFVKEFVE
ncbi:Hypothetical predicted protein, partial [Drosophila guanche]